jgi:hypothetical protein
VPAELQMPDGSIPRGNERQQVGRAAIEECCCSQLVECLGKGRGWGARPHGAR